MTIFIQFIRPIPAHGRSQATDHRMITIDVKRSLSLTLVMVFRQLKQKQKENPKPHVRRTWHKLVTGINVLSDIRLDILAITKMLKRVVLANKYENSYGTGSRVDLRHTTYNITKI